MLHPRVVLLATLWAPWAAAAPVLTGDAELDFADMDPAVQVHPDPDGVDVGMPSVFPAGTISGHDVRDLRLSYDIATDVLYVAINGYRIVGDADADGDPNGTSATLAGLSGLDDADFGGSESVAVYFDLDQDGTYDVIAGVPFGEDRFGAVVALFDGSALTPSLSFGDPLPGRLGAFVGGTGPTAPDVEMAILGFSTLPSSGVDLALDLSVAAFTGSFADAGIGEDFLPGFSTSFGFCGDGVVEPGEDCDDGDGDDTDACTTTCEHAACGDGFTQAVLGEACDDGNGSDNDLCTTACEEARCGDGFFQPLAEEDCDDGNTSDGDLCTNVCEHAACGDGIVQPALGETCDDGNDLAGDGCDPACEIEVCLGDLLAAQGTNLFLGEDYAGSVDAGGHAVVGGDAAILLADVGWQDPGGAALIVGGDLEVEYGTFYGDVVHGGYISGVGLEAEGVVVQGTPIDIPAAHGELVELSDRLAGLATNGSVLLSTTGALLLSGTDPERVVIDIFGASLAVAESIHIVAPATATVVINVHGDDVLFTGPPPTFAGIDPSRVVWNLYEASCAHLYTEWAGTLLAPYATVSFFSGSWHGTLVGWALAGVGEVSFGPFTGTLPCDDDPPVPLGTCGDGGLDPDESCDDGGQLGGDGCSATCSSEAACGDGVLDLGEWCDDGNVAGFDGCTSSCLPELGLCGNGVVEAPEECDGDPGCGIACLAGVCQPGLGTLRGFNVVAFGDYVGGSLVEGRVGAAGSVLLSSFSVGFSAGGPGVVAAGSHLLLADGELAASAWYGLGAGVDDPSSLDFPDGGGLVMGSPLDWDQLVLLALRHSQTLASAPVTAATTVAPQGARFRSLAQPVHSFVVSAADIEGGTLWVDVDGRTPTVINVLGTHVDLSGRTVVLEGTTAGWVTWNFPEAMSLDLDGATMLGAVLAPRADVSLDAASVTGTLIGHDVIGDGTLHHARSRVQIDCP